MMKHFGSIFKAPIFDDEQKTHQAYLLNIIIWGLIIVPIPYVIYTLIASPANILRALIQGGAGEAINLVILFLLRRGHVRSASIAQVICFWIFFTISAATGVGVQGESYLLGYPLVIVIAGVLIGSDGALTTTAISLISGLFMVYAGENGLINMKVDRPAIMTWVLSLAIFPMGAALQYLSALTVNKALKHARQSEEKYRLISRVSSDYAFESRINKEGVAEAIWLGGAFEKMTGYTPEEYFAAGGWYAHVHPDDLEQDNLDMKKLFNNEDVQGSVIRTFTKKGETRWERVFAHPIWSAEENRLIGILGAVQDITEQKQAEGALTKERDLLQIFMDNIPDTIYFKDTTSRFLRVNKAQAEFLKLNDPGEAIGKTDLDFQPLELAQQFMEEEKHILESEQAVINRIEFNPTADGKLRWFSATKVPVKDSMGHLIGTIGISRDITEQKEAQEKLQKIFLQQEAILNNIPDMAWLKDTESRYIAVNEQFLRICGLNYEDIIGKTDVEIWDADYAKNYRADDLEVIQSGIRKTVEETQKDSSGREYWVETTKTPIYNKHREVIGTTGIAREITQRKLAEISDQIRREMLEKVVQLGKRVTEVSDLKITLERIWHGVHDDLGFDRPGIFLYNPEHNTMVGSYGTNHQGEMVDEKDLHVLLNNNSTEALAFIDVIKEGNRLQFTHNYSLENGIPKGHIMDGVKDHALVAAWAGDKPVGVISVDNVITGRPIGGEQLEALRLFAGYAGLAIENARLNDTLENDLNQRKSLIEELEKKNIELERFTYTVSHDLKSPLVTITGFLGYLEQDARAGKLDNFKRDMDRIQQAVDKMQILLNDLLELSRIGRIMHEPVEEDFGAIVRDALSLLNGSITAGNIQVDFVDEGHKITGDRVRLLEVLQNLVENAIKFMGDQPVPEIHIGSIKDDEGKPVFFVQDNGIGIEPQYQDRVFGIFNKLDAKTEGSGIGLTLVKRIIEVHNGNIWLTSQPGKGTTFFFTIPGANTNE